MMSKSRSFLVSHTRPSITSTSKFFSGRTEKNWSAIWATAGSSSTAVIDMLGHALVVVPGGAAAAEADDRGALQRRRVGEAGGHRLGVVDGKVEFVVGIDDRLCVAEPLGTEGERVESVGPLVDVDVVVERFDAGNDAGLVADGERFRLALSPQQDGDDRSDHDKADDRDDDGGTGTASGRRGRRRLVRGSRRLPGGFPPGGLGWHLRYSWCRRAQYSGGPWHDNGRPAANFRLGRGVSPRCGASAIRGGRRRARPEHRVAAPRGGNIMADKTGKPSASSGSG